MHTEGGAGTCIMGVRERSARFGSDIYCFDRVSSAIPYKSGEFTSVTESGETPEPKSRTLREDERPPMSTVQEAAVEQHVVDRAFSPYSKHCLVFFTDRYTDNYETLRAR